MNNAPLEETTSLVLNFILSQPNTTLASFAVGYVLAVPEICKVSMRERGKQIGVSHNAISSYCNAFKLIMAANGYEMERVRTKHTPKEPGHKCATKSPEHRQKLSDALKGRPSHRKGKSLEKPFSDEHRERLRAAWVVRKAKEQSGESVPKKRGETPPEVRKKISEALKGNKNAVKEREVE